ncbi:MAG: hypothetical protein RL764_1599 [Pseudomonadota bacterium]
MTQAADLARRALAMAESGNESAAWALFDQGLAQFPNDGRLANSVGNFHARAGRNEEALSFFERALVLNSELDEAALNAAIILLRLNRAEAAERLLAARSDRLASSARYWALLGDAQRLTSKFDDADLSYDSALRRDPKHPRALAGRARLALERGESQSVVAYEDALAQAPGDPDLFAQYAQALFAAGRIDEALDCARALTEQLPAWSEGHALYAEMLWASGQKEAFGATFQQAIAKQPSPDLWLRWADVLSGVDQFEEASQHLETAHQKWPDHEDIALQLCITLGEAGRAAAAEALWTRVAKPQSRDWQIARARNLLRLGAVSQVENMLSALLEKAPEDVTAWALIDLCWRLLDDPRQDWLHGQANLVQAIPLPLSTTEFEAAHACLRELHRLSGPPIGQSVKQGSQTKGALFARRAPELQRLKSALVEVLEHYRSTLPPRDERHPLLSRSNMPWAISKSWSIRLSNQGKHAAHVHPDGLISSACYFEVPHQVKDAGGPGWIDLGLPPDNLVTGLSPLLSFEPQPGMCLLFPSTLFHGTRAISHGDRMTVAFDVSAATSDQTS